MNPANEQAIESVRRIPGELSFEARIGGARKQIWMRSDTQVVPAAEAALAICLMPAMRLGGTLRIDEPLSPRLLRNQREFEAIQRAWSLQRELGEPPLAELEVQAPARAWEPRPPTGRVAALFSGGVDSWATILGNPDVTDLIFCRGVDLLAHLPHQRALADEIEARLREAAAELGLDFHALDTNARELADPLIRWERYFACPLIAAGLFFEPLFDRVLIAGDSEYATQDARGGNRLTPRLLSTEDLEIADDGGRFSRMERTARIAAHPVVQKTLRVCWENPGGAYNCGHCVKCLMTWASFHAVGHGDDIATFPGELDSAALVECEIYQPASLMLREEVLDVATENEAEILPQILAATERGRRDLGMRPDQRLRPEPGSGPPGPGALDQEIADLRAAPGELSFEARIGGEARRIWFRTETPVTPPADAALAACLLPAMRHGGSLKMSGPVSPRVLRNQRELAAVQRAFSRRWELPDDPLAEVEVTAPLRAVPPRPPTGRVAAFFSGGIDSWATVLSTPDLTDLIFVRGLDILPGAAHQDGLAEQTEARLREAADELGLELHVVETNVRELSDPLVPWEAYFACPLAAVGLMFEPLFDRVLIAGDADYETQGVLNFGAIWTVDQLWSSERVEIVDAGGRLNREQRALLAAESPVARRTLRVCWENPGGAYNCGRCSKCMRTMIGFEARGIRERFPSFPPELDLGRLEELRINQVLQLCLWEDTLRTIRDHGRTDLEGPVAAFVRRGREGLGLAPDFATRAVEPGVEGEPGGEVGGEPEVGSAGSRPAPPPLPLLADAATARALAEARALAVLVGSYDGSGNFGDIAQFEAALALLAPLAPDLLVLSMIELVSADSHANPAGPPPRGVGHVLYFDPDGHGGAGLAPVTAPADLAYRACYLYGGGFLNSHWGERKLAMVAAAEALLGGEGARIVRLGSGQQVDPEWLDGLAPAARETLRAFEPLAGRDPVSTAALATLSGAGGALESGDDAVAVLPAPPRPAPLPAADGPLRINLNFAEHGWVSGHPETMQAFYVELLAELSRLSGRPLLAQPLIAYLDPRVDERPGLERLAAACAERGVELAEPRLLRVPELEALAPELAAASLTLSCSYHVALTSLLLGVPALLVEDSAYYEQKAGGLVATFGLPPELASASTRDAAALAAGIAATVLDPAAGAALREQLRERAAALRERRRVVEVEILARLGAGAIAALAADRDAGDDGERLAEVLGSRSWRAGAPLRRAGRAFRAWRGRR